MGQDETKIGQDEAKTGQDGAHVGSYVAYALRKRDFLKQQKKSFA